MIIAVNNSLDCEIGRVNASNPEDARQWLAANILPYLEEGDTIRVVKVY